MIIAIRTLTVETPEGERPVEVKIFQPEHAGREHEWDCRYEIDWPEGKRRGFGGGNDALAAILAAVDCTAVDVYASPYHTARKMFWLKPWVGYGLPMHKGAREVLIGHDQEFFGLDPKDGN